MRGSSEETGRIRRLCMALPEVTERLSHGEATWFVQDKKVMVVMSDHHHDDRLGLWAAAPLGVQESFIQEDPTRYFRPPYVGHRGWIGVYLDVDVDWDQIGDIILAAYKTVAPKKLLDRNITN